MNSRRTYILTIEDRKRLHALMNWKFSRWAGALIAIAVVVFFVAIGFVAGFGYAGGKEARLSLENRGELTDLLLRLDSLNEVIDRNKVCINNVLHLMDTGRIPDDTTAFDRSVAPLPLDSLHPAGELESSFVSNMERQGNFRVAALASMAAEGVRFGSIAFSGVQTQRSLGEEEAEIVIPSQEPVLSPADAKVLDIYFSGIEGGYTVILQHPRGFLSRISGMSRVIVDAGATLSAGDAIGFGPGRNSRFRNIVRLQLWHNGASVLPADFIEQSGYTKSNYDRM